MSVVRQCKRLVPVGKGSMVAVLGTAVEELNKHIKNLNTDNGFVKLLMIMPTDKLLSAVIQKV